MKSSHDMNSHCLCSSASLWGMNLHKSSVNVHGGFDQSHLYRCLIHPPSFREPSDDLISQAFANVSASQETERRLLLGSS
jgi:hypothetical protein